MREKIGGDSSVAAHHRWKKYRAAAGTGIGIRQLRHAHASELINSGVSIEVVRRRLGCASTEITQVYTLLADQVADAEIRTARRRGPVSELTGCALSRLNAIACTC